MRAKRSGGGVGGIQRRGRLLRRGVGNHCAARGLATLHGMGQAGGAADSAVRPLAQHADNRGIGDDRADNQEPAKPAQFCNVKAGDEQRHPQKRQTHHHRQQFQTDAGTDRDHVQQRSQNGVAEQTAQAKRMRPAGTRHQSCRIDRAERHRNHRKHDAAQHPVGPAMQHKAGAPDHQDQRNPPSPHTTDDDQSRRGRSPEATQHIGGGFVGGDHPAGIVGRIAVQHQRRRDPDRNQHQPQQLASAAFQHGLHVLIQ